MGGMSGARPDAYSFHTPLEALGLPGRLQNVLKREGIRTVEVLRSNTIAELLDIRYVSTGGINCIQSALVRAGWPRLESGYMQPPRSALRG